MEQERISMVFYTSFLDAIRNLPTRELQAEATLALVEMGIDGVVGHENPMINMVLTMALPSVASAKQRYSKAVIDGKKGGRPRKAEPLVVAQLLEEGLTKHDIAGELNCSVRTVERALEKVATKPCDKTTDRQNLDIDKDNNINIDKDNNNNNDREIDNPSSSFLEKGEDQPLNLLEKQNYFGERQGDFVKAVGDLRKKGFSDEWIQRAIDRKSNDVFMKHGFGLIFMPDYIEEVNAEMAAETAQQERIAKSWANYNPQTVTKVIPMKQKAKKEIKLLSLEDLIAQEG